MNRLFFAFLGIVSFAAAANAAEIRLKNVPVCCSESLVTLGDIADILPMGNENTKPLRQTILFPAPAEGKTLDQWELRDLLSHLGINSLHHSITGAEKIVITKIADGNTAAQKTNEQFVVQANYLTPAGTNSVTPVAVTAESFPKVAGITDDLVKMLEKQVSQALNVYLNFTHKIEKTWEISLKLTPEQVKLLATNGQIVEINGGQVPLVGLQQFHIRMQTNVTITVDASVSLPTEIVVVRRTLPKGHIITESDVMLQRVDKESGENFFVDVRRAVGKETVKAVKELSVLTADAVRMPYWVRKGEIVTVRAANNGIVVRTEAAALQDGVEGDTISVSKINSAPIKGGKKSKEEPVTYLVRVCAPKTVEVFVN